MELQMTMTRIVAPGFAMFLAATVMNGCARDMDATFNQLPPRVQDTVRVEVGDGRIEDVETYAGMDGELYYEVEYEKHDTDFEFHVDDQGRLIARHDD